MNKKSSERYFPPDWLFHYSLILVIPVIAILTGILLPALHFLTTTSAFVLFYAASSAGALGSILLFFARRPLYEQQRFWTIGPSELPRLNRRPYWLAYVFVV